MAKFDMGQEQYLDHTINEKQLFLLVIKDSLRREQVFHIVQMDNFNHLVNASKEMVLAILVTMAILGTMAILEIMVLVNNALVDPQLHSMDKFDILQMQFLDHIIKEKLQHLLVIKDLCLLD